VTEVSRDSVECLAAVEHAVDEYDPSIAVADFADPEL